MILRLINIGAIHSRVAIRIAVNGTWQGQHHPLSQYRLYVIPEGDDCCSRIRLLAFFDGIGCIGSDIAFPNIVRMSRPCLEALSSSIVVN